MTEIKLPRRQQHLYDLLRSKGDVDIAALCIAMHAKPYVLLRDKQHWLTPYIHRLNRRLQPYGQRVVPGERRHSYRLTVL